MKLIRKSNENEMILEFLKGEINSNRFNKDLYNVLNELNIYDSIILNGNINNDKENKIRMNIMNKYRGYPNKELFENFPNIYEWKYVELNSNDIDNIYYIDYDYWNILSNNTSKPTIAAKVINSGKNAIMLVPEISLTTQIINKFYDRFGNDVAIFHSALSDGEKYDEYLKIYRGEVHIVIGTRSAIFTPLENLGIIIIDEEHSDTYKQDSNPRYHALDMAIFRTKYHNIPLVLGSATPSLETMARAL